MIPIRHSDAEIALKKVPVKRLEVSILKKQSSLPLNIVRKTIYPTIHPKQQTSLAVIKELPPQQQNITKKAYGNKFIDLVSKSTTAAYVSQKEDSTISDKDKVNINQITDTVK